MLMTLGTLGILLVLLVGGLLTVAFHLSIIKLAAFVGTVAMLLLMVAYLTFAERKVIGYIQVRIGPNRVGPRGWLQPIADQCQPLFICDCPGFIYGASVGRVGGDAVC